MSCRKYGIFVQKVCSARYTAFSSDPKFRMHAVFQHFAGSHQTQYLRLKPQVHVKYLTTVKTVRKHDFSDRFNEIVPNSDLSFSEWVNVKKSLMQEIKMIDKINVDSVMLQKLSNRDDLVAAKSFAKYLLTSNKHLNLSCIGKVLKLYYIRALQEVLTEDEKSHIIELCRDITSKYPIPEFSTAENVIYGLSVTSEWKETIKLLDNMKPFSPPAHSTYSIIIATAFKNNEPDIAFEILDKLVKNNRIPLDNVYLSWLDFCVSHSKNKNDLLSLLQGMFDFSSKNDFTISHDVATKVHTVFTELLKWKGAFTYISKSGTCPCCKGTLNTLLISKEDHDRMRKEFYEKVVIGKNVFLKTLPEEIDKFLKYLDQNAPFDMVIDGLNVSYSISSQASLKTKSSLVVKVVKSLMKEHKKILCIGRKHMLKWPKEDINFILNNTSSFFLENLSHDDPFLLYAAMTGQHTCFLSRDYMRGHKALLGEDTQIIFKRWQQSHQHLLIYANDTGKVGIDKPMKHSPSTQRGTSWHIPYNTQNQLYCPHELRFPEKWLCLQPNAK